MNNPNILVKLILFSVVEGKLKIFFPNLELPNGDLLKEESLDIAAIRIFRNSTRLSFGKSYLEQLYTIIDKIGGQQAMNVSYFILYPGYKINDETLPGFIDTQKINKNNKDYSIVSYAVQRLRWKIEYTNVVYSLLPEDFTLSELQNTYQAIMGKFLDKRNFRKKILSLGLLKLSGKTRTGVKARPAQMYEFKSRKPVMVKVFS